MVNRLKIILEQPEYSGLLKAAASELRQPEAQVRYFVREALEQRGLLAQETGAAAVEVANDDTTH
jgi:hypothetical protein